MLLRKMAALLVTTAFIAALAQAQPELQSINPAEQTSTEAVDEILVVGEQPGPHLWKVMRDDHVLWIMGVLSPLPKNMSWRSSQVETALAESREFILPPNVKLQVSFWGKVGLLPSLVGVKNNPDGQTLQEVLPPDIYSRWLVLKEKYIGRDKSIEKERPIFAAVHLFKKSIEKSGMVPSDFVRWRLEQIVREHKIKTTAPILDHKLENPRAVVKKFKKSSLDDIECFTKTIERLETDLDAMRARANAWATGDIEALRKLPYPDNTGACTAVVTNSEFAQEEGLQDIEAQLAALWLQAVDEALAANTSSFAILPMAQLLKPDGYVAKLKAKGYEVEIE